MNFIWLYISMKHIIAFCLTALLASVTWAQAPLVISTHPIYLIAKEITQGVEEPVLLLKNQSGHDVQLTPENRKTVLEASLVIWLGKAHEAPLEKVLGNNAKAVSILDSGIIQALPLRNTRGVVLKDTIDTHVWLDPNNAVRIGFFIAALRSQQYPENKTVYWNNAKKFANEMLLVSQKFSGAGAARPYWAYHDAYQYLERSLNLKFSGAMTDDPHIAPTVAQIKFLNDTRPYKKMCLLAEASASPNQYRKLGEIAFQSVDESLAKQQDFVVAWQNLAQIAQACVLNARK